VNIWYSLQITSCDVQVKNRHVISSSLIKRGGSDTSKWPGLQGPGHSGLEVTVQVVSICCVAANGDKNFASMEGYILAFRRAKRTCAEQGLPRNLV